MYGHPALVVEHARALAPSARAFRRWFYLSLQMEMFPRVPGNDSLMDEMRHCRASSPPSPAPAPGLDQAGGSFFEKIAVSSTTAIKSHG